MHGRDHKPYVIILYKTRGYIGILYINLRGRSSFTDGAAVAVAYYHRDGQEVVVFFFIIHVMPSKIIGCATAVREVVEWSPRTTGGRRAEHDEEDTHECSSVTARYYSIIVATALIKY